MFLFFENQRILSSKMEFLNNVYAYILKAVINHRFVSSVGPLLTRNASKQI